MILFINACVRNNSRTKELADTLLQKLGEYEEVKLFESDFPELDEKLLLKREKDCADMNFDDPYYDIAKQFKNADTVVIASPYWDLSFAASLKRYIENIMISGITFEYSDKGIPVGLCSADKLYYITTSGGPVQNYDFGFGYIKSIAEGMLGVRECICYSAENLDIVGNDPEEILDSVKRKIENDF